MIFRNQDGKLDLISVLGIATIVSGLIFMYPLIEAVYTMPEIIDYLIMSIVSYAAFILAGVVALASGKHECGTRISIVCILLGISLVISNKDIAEYYEYTSFVVTILSFLVGIVVITSSFGLLCGYTHYSNKLFWSMGIMALMSAYPLWYMYDLLMPISDVLRFGYMYIPRIACYAIAMMAVHQESIRIPPTTEKIDRNLGIIKDMLYSDGETYITPEDAARLRDFMGSSEDGHAEAVLRSQKETRILAITREKGRTFVEIVPESGRLIMNTFRFYVDSMTDVDDCMIRIYGGPGIFIQIVVHPMPPKKDLKRRFRRTE